MPALAASRRPPATQVGVLGGGLNDGPWKPGGRPIGWPLRPPIDDIRRRVSVPLHVGQATLSAFAAETMVSKRASQPWQVYS